MPHLVCRIIRATRVYLVHLCFDIMLVLCVVIVLQESIFMPMEIVARGSIGMIRSMDKVKTWPSYTHGVNVSVHMGVMFAVLSLCE